MSTPNTLIRFLIGMLTLSSVYAANTVFLNTSGDGLWNTSSNWSLEAVPGAADNVTLNNGRTARLAVAGNAVNQITIGNNATANTLLEIQADISIGTIRIASANNSIGDVLQSDGTVTCIDSFQIAATSSNSGGGSYTIRGGSLLFSGVSMSIGSQGPGSLIVEGAAVDALQGNDLTLGSQATLQFTLDTLGVTPLTLAGDLTVHTESSLIVDGTDYEAMNGFFPLLSCEGTLGSFAQANVTLLGFEGREAKLITQSNGLWLRLLAPPGFTDQLCDVVPASTIAEDYSETNFSISRAFENSGSVWTPDFHEAYVMDAILKQDVLSDESAATNRSWELRMGRSGAICSFRTPALGETIPPQWRHPNGTYGKNFAPWIDDLWQGVAVDTIAKNASDEKWFIHQAGTYLKDPAQQSEPFYSPQVASTFNEAERSFTTVNWGQQAHTDLLADEISSNDFQSHLLYYTRLRDLGQGLIEVSLGFYNFGQEYINHINVPWGGVRQSTLNDFFLSKPDGTWAWASQGWDSDGDLTKDYAETGGWMGFSDSLDGSTPALGIVYGSDSSPMLENQPRESYLWWKQTDPSPDKLDPASSRNYGVFATVRKYNIPQGNGVWGRYYFVLGDDVADVAERIENRGLLDGDTLIPFDYTEGSSPLIGYSFSGSGADFRVEVTTDSPQFYLYAEPVLGSFPIFEIIENDYSRYLSWDPYATGVVKTYDGTLSSTRLLGFALRTADINGGGLTYTYEDLATVLTGATGNYLPAGESLSVRLSSEVTLPDAVAHWALDDATDLVAVDSSGNEHNAIVTGAAWDVGVERGALYFDGSEDSVSVPIEAFAGISSQISIAMWAYGGSSQPAQDSVFSAVDADSNRVLNIHLPWSNGSVFWDAGFSGTYDRISQLADEDAFMGQWNHWVFTKNAITGDMKIYLNGTLWHSGNEKTKLITGITGAWIGSSDDPSTGSYDGLLDEVILFNRALSASEVITLYNRYILPKDYNAWLQEQPELNDTSFIADPEKDGVVTGLEYVLNGTPTAVDVSILPILDASGEHFVFSFIRTADSVPFTTLVFQYGSNLTGWTDLKISSQAASEVSFGPVADGIQTVTVTLDKNLAIDGKLFGRLKAIQNE